MHLPARNAIGINEILVILECLLHYKKRGLDPGYQDYYEEKYTTEFCKFMGGGYADAVSSGCASIYIAIKSLELPPKSLIATSPVTDASVIGCITEQGHIPYLIDSSPGSYNTSIQELTERYDENIRAFVITHAGGEPCNILPIKEFCSAKNIELIEDCSQAIGAIPTNGEKPVGTYGRFGCFSTMYRKNLSVSGSSGLVFANNYEDYKLARQYADRGKKWWNQGSVDMRDPGFASFPGLNFNSDEFRCAIGSANIKRLRKINQKRREVLEYLITKMKEEKINLFKPYNYHSGFSPFYFPIFVNEKNASKSVVEISEDLKNLGLGIGVKYGCLVSTWEWAKPFMYDNFISKNALKTRDSCFHLYLNENYKKKHINFIVKSLKRYQSEFENPNF